MSEPVIEVRHLSKSFGTHVVLRDVDFTVNPGDVTCIIGASGSGKSTLLRCINKLEEITSGDLIVDGLKVNDPKVDERLIRQEAGMVFQQFYLFPHLTALENVMFGPLRVRGANKEEAEKLARELLAKVGLAERAHHYPSELSGGQQQRLCIARGIAIRPEVLLLDEPCSALDPISTGRIEELITELKQDYTVVIVTHNMQQAARCSDHTAFMYLGELIEFSNTDDLFTKPAKKQTEDYITGRYG